MWTRGLVLVFLAALVATTSACSGGGDHEVTYRVTSPDLPVSAKQLTIEYLDEDGQRVTDSTATVSGAEWTTTVTVPGDVDRVFVHAFVVPDGSGVPINSRYSVSCSVTVDGVERSQNKAWTECNAQVRFADLS